MTKYSYHMKYVIESKIRNYLHIFETDVKLVKLSQNKFKYREMEWLMNFSTGIVQQVQYQMLKIALILQSVLNTGHT